MSADAQDFKSALGRFASGVTVITVAGQDGDHGMTASAFCSVSLEPPLILVCVKKGNTTHGLLTAAKGFGVNLLSADQVSISNRFAGWGFPEDQDKWADLEISRGATSGAALIGGAMAWLDCTSFAAHDAGDHTIFVGLVEAAESFGERDDLAPLLYFAGKYRDAGQTL